MDSQVKLVYCIMAAMQLQGDEPEEALSLYNNGENFPQAVYLGYGNMVEDLEEESQDCEKATRFLELCKQLTALYPSFSRPIPYNKFRYQVMLIVMNRMAQDPDEEFMAQEAYVAGVSEYYEVVKDLYSRLSAQQKTAIKLKRK
jgi:hypothetical protein